MMTLSQSGQLGDLLAANLDHRMRGEGAVMASEETVAVDRKRAAGRHLVVIGGLHDERIQPSHFLMQQTDRIGFAIIGSEMSWSTRARPSGRSCARLWSSPAAFRV